MEQKTEILEMRHISKRFYGVQALDDVDFSVNPGEIHALIGENGAGKSTLMKIALGLYTADDGETFFKGKPANFRSASESLHAGLAMIHQEISLVPTLDIAENIWLGRERKFSKAGLICKRQRYQQTERLLKELQIALNPKTLVSALTVAQMQMVELARAVSYNADLIIMDEPTSALSDSEIENLYGIVRRLSGQGKAIIFISHKLEELFAVCERFTIMRDGKVVAMKQVQDISMEQLIAMISGRPITESIKAPKTVCPEIALDCRGLCTDNGVNNVSFQLHKGEILGFSGLIGAGRTEIMRAVYGLDPLTGGSMEIYGKPVHFRSPRQAVHAGIAMITEDRLRSGALHSMSVKCNLTLSNLYRICTKLGFIKARKEKRSAEEYIRSMDVKISHIEQRMADLSGGNQQKIIIGRALITTPTVMIMDEPTRGIDVGAKAEIHSLICELAANGLSVLLVSSELPEIMKISDRILVIRGGQVAAEYQRSEVTQEKIMRAAFGVQR